MYFTSVRRLIRGYMYDLRCIITYSTDNREIKHRLR